jgi:hypothetical protein
MPITMHEGKGIGRILNDCLQDGKGIVAKLRTKFQAERLGLENSR